MENSEIPASTAAPETTGDAEISSIRIPGTDKYTPVQKPSGADKSSDADKKPEHPLAEPRVTNSQAAQTRINRTNQKLRDKIAELEARVARMDRENPEEKFVADQLDSQIDTYSTIVDSNETEEFASRASEAFGADTDNFMEQTYRYAKHVNNNEPEVRQYINQPYGMILLREWYKRMDQPNNRAEWLNMPALRKARVLERFYEQIENVANEIRSGKYASNAPAIAKKQNIPAARGGRNSNEAAVTDDFGIALQQAVNNFKRR